MSARIGSPPSAKQTKTVDYTNMLRELGFDPNEFEVVDRSLGSKQVLDQRNAKISTSWTQQEPERSLTMIKGRWVPLVTHLMGEAHIALSMRTWTTTIMNNRGSNNRAKI